MFDKEYAFRGKHSKMVQDLTKKFDIKNNQFFQRNYDVYLLAPIIGFLYQRKAEIDNDTTINPTKIFGDILIKNSDDLMFTYRQIMLLDKQYEPSSEIRIEKAFRGIKNEEDEALYESYVRGGVEVLYEKLMDGVTSPDDYVNRLYDFLEEFDERYNQNIDMEKVLENCRKIKA